MTGYRDKWFDSNDSNHGWYTCIRCGKKLRKNDVDIDHIIPQKHGGRDNLNNLQCMCKSCNRSKKDNLNNTVTDYSKNTLKNTKKTLDGLFKKLK
ncbi:TPA: HNH endonuclease [Clostridioides difficile]|uniref:HNH endonuclease n=1 Tax=Clostridioides difficile TaxID=1496 RepID=UPI00038DBE35|nr:HNH endonuclease signature motif containing protein [Clostridioides difficile]OFU12931.1 HNH endonuclease [Clostridium sp. HMSC19C11]EGT3709109.1 HNH endonuclease [Clostridioides difficile]EGT3817468.1 HNH endonuclease [Clostridioides difficile]EGT4083706.1 HNH endonuclease [Clostridioides difficile]EGT5123238.1 HNH endonuclease [Clostridioides difficile]